MMQNWPYLHEPLVLTTITLYMKFYLGCKCHGYICTCTCTLYVQQTFCFENPGSITNTTPSIVRDVSAMFVDTTHLRPMAPLARLGGAGSKMRCCCWGGSVEYRGMQRNSPISGPKLSISFFNLLQASSISWVKRTK